MFDVHDVVALTDQRMQKLPQLANILKMQPGHGFIKVMTMALAGFARHANVWQKMHLNLDDPVALTRLRTATRDVEAEVA